MSPEYGATIAIFPIDEMTLDYLRLTGRDEAHVQLVEAYAKEQGLFRTADAPDPVYTATLELDLSTVEPSLAGPKRPQDRVSLRQAKMQVPAGARGDADASAKPKPRGAEKPGDDSSPASQTSRPPRSRREPIVPGMEGLDHGVGGHRGDHELHEHVEPERDDRRRPARAEGRRARPEA